MKQIDISDEILEERDRQDQKWGEQNHNMGFWLAILMEEVGEAAKSLLQNKPEEFRKEIVQCGAVCVAILECFDRNNWIKRKMK